MVIPNAPFKKNVVTSFMRDRAERGVEMFDLGSLKVCDPDTYTRQSIIPLKMERSDDIFIAFARSFSLIVGESPCHSRSTTKINP